MDSPKEYTIGFVTSKDGTKIGYRQMGLGPGVILVHGGLQASQSFMEMGKYLSAEFTVYIPDRRGRGLSDGFGNNYNPKSDCEDVLALIMHTKAENIFGLSSGAIITLQTALVEPFIKKLAVYEPPIPIVDLEDADMDEEYEDALEKGDLGKAMISIIRRTGDSSLLASWPIFLTVPFMNFIIKRQLKKIKGDDVSLMSLVPTFHYDRIIVRDAEGLVKKIKKLKSKILLLGGSESKPFLKIAVDQLHAMLPMARRIEFRGLGHTAPANDGHPRTVGRALKNFFK